jgi:hypothetical protein
MQRHISRQGNELFLEQRRVSLHSGSNTGWPKKASPHFPFLHGRGSLSHSLSGVQGCCTCTATVTHWASCMAGTVSVFPRFNCATYRPTEATKLQQSKANFRHTVLIALLVFDGIHLHEIPLAALRGAKPGLKN